MEPAVREHTAVADRITALAVVSDGRWGERAVTSVEGDDLSIRTTPSLADATTSLEDVDCLVVDHSIESAPPGEFLEGIRDRAPGLPVVFLADGDDGSTGIVDAVRDHRWTDYVEQDGSTTLERLIHRVRTLVERRRLDTLSRRSRASIELAHDAIAIVDPDGEIEFANRSYAMQFGYDRDDLSGTPWQTLFSGDCVEHLETAAIPTVTDGWRWTGRCHGRRKTGSTFPVRVRLGGLEDGSLVFVIDTPDTDGESREAN